MEEGHCTDKDKLEEKDCPKCKGDCKCEEMKKGNEDDNKKKFKKQKKFDNDSKPPKGAPPAAAEEEDEKENTLQEAIRRIAKAKKVFLKGKRIK